MNMNLMGSRWAMGAVLASLVVAAGVGNAAEPVDRIERSFTLAPGGRVAVDVDRGSIRVSGREGDRVEVVVTREATGGSASRREELLKGHEVTFEEMAGVVRVQARSKSKQDDGWGWGRRPNLSVSYELVVPRKCNLELKTAGGGIRVAEVAGDVKSQTAGGGLRFEGVEGAIEGRTSGGGIDILRSKGEVNARTSGGGIRVEEAEGPIAVSTSGGSITLSRIAGRCTAKTSGGSIRASGMRGPIEGTTSGGSISVEFETVPEADCALETAGGSVTVVVPENAALNLDARTSAGRVSSELPVVAVVSGETKRGELNGKINGGGPLLKLRTSAGGIVLRKR